MKVSISDEIRKNDASLAVAIGRINSILAAVLGETAAEKATAQWELAGELKDRVLFLQLWYEGQGAGATIDPAELEKPDKLRGKLRDLWDDLLQVRLDGILKGIWSILNTELVS